MTTFAAVSFLFSCSPKPQNPPPNQQAASPPRPLRRATLARPQHREASDTVTRERHPLPSILRGRSSNILPTQVRAITPARLAPPAMGARCLRLSTTGSSRRRVTGRGRRCTLGEFGSFRVLLSAKRERGRRRRKKKKREKKTHPLSLPSFLVNQSNQPFQGPAERQRLPRAVPPCPLLLLPHEPLRKKEREEVAEEERVDG